MSVCALPLFAQGHQLGALVAQSDATLGLVVGVLCTVSWLLGHALGYRHGSLRTATKRIAARRARERAKREPKVAASWLRRNCFRRGIGARQPELPMPEVRILS